MTSYRMVTSAGSSRPTLALVMPISGLPGRPSLAVRAEWHGGRPDQSLPGHGHMLRPAGPGGRPIRVSRWRRSARPGLPIAPVIPDQGLPPVPALPGNLPADQAWVLVHVPARATPSSRCSRSAVVPIKACLAPPRPPDQGLPTPPARPGPGPARPRPPTGHGLPGSAGTSRSGLPGGRPPLDRGHAGSRLRARRRAANRLDAIRAHARRRPGRPLPPAAGTKPCHAAASTPQPAPAPTPPPQHRRAASAALARSPTRR